MKVADLRLERTGARSYPAPHADREFSALSPCRVRYTIPGARKMSLFSAVASEPSFSNGVRLRSYLGSLARTLSYMSNEDWTRLQRVQTQ